MIARCAKPAGVFALLFALYGCVAPPMAPTIPAVPGPGKTSQEFGTDMAVCEQFATAQTAPAANMANQQAIGGALIGTALGAGLGAAVGGGHGAAIGAASGAAAGTVYGAANAPYAQSTLQRQYDIAYAQCMYAHGNRVPGFGPPRRRYGPPPGGGYGPPPPGYGPPPGQY